MKVIILLLSVLMTGAMYLIPAEVAAADTVSSVQQTAAPVYQILFFMNPNGRPCQMQDGIIKAMGESLSGKATVKYYKTTQRDDYAAFGTYGIRGLPSLIILDEKGKEVKRFTPGIHDAATILKALKSEK
jgi:thioredoxin 1